MELAELDGALLKNAALQRAILRSAKLGGADMSHADLTRADLRRAHMDYAILRHAKLRDSRLEEVLMCGADLTCADLRGAQITFPFGFGSLSMKIDRRIAAYIAAFFCEQDCDDPDYLQARETMLKFAGPVITGERSEAATAERECAPGVAV
jgi:hypothetical protein